MGTPESQVDTNTKLKRIAWLSSKDETRQFDSLIHHFNESSLEDCFHRQDGRKSVGADGITKVITQVNDVIVSLVREIRTLGSNEGDVRVTGIPTL